MSNTTPLEVNHTNTTSHSPTSSSSSITLTTTTSTESNNAHEVNRKRLPEEITKEIIKKKKADESDSEGDVDLVEDLERCNALFQQLSKSLKAHGMTATVVGDSLVPIQTSAVKKFVVLDGRVGLSFVDNPLHSDKIVTVGERSYFCHTAYLSKRSEYFRAMFQNNMKEKAEKEINISGLPELGPGIFLEILRYLYSGTLPSGLYNPETILLSLQCAGYLRIACLQEKLIEKLADNVMASKGLLAPLNCTSNNLEEFLFCKLLDIVHKILLPKDVTAIILQWTSEIDTTATKLFNKYVDINKFAWSDIDSKAAQLFPPTAIFKKAKEQTHLKQCKQCNLNIPAIAFDITHCVVYAHGYINTTENCTACLQHKDTEGCQEVSVHKNHKTLVKHKSKNAV